MKAASRSVFLFFFFYWPRWERRGCSSRPSRACTSCPRQPSCSSSASRTQPPQPGCKPSKHIGHVNSRAFRGDTRPTIPPPPGFFGGQAYGQTDRHTDGYTYVRTVFWTDRRSDEQTNGCTLLLKKTSALFKKWFYLWTSSIMVWKWMSLLARNFSTSATRSSDTIMSALLQTNY